MRRAGHDHVTHSWPCRCQHLIDVEVLLGFDTPKAMPKLSQRGNASMYIQADLELEPSQPQSHLRKLVCAPLTSHTHHMSVQANMRQ
jgi:hypothetical protein